MPLKNWKSSLRPSHTFCLCQHSLCLVISFLQNLSPMGMRSHIQPMYSPAASAPPTSTDQMSSTCALRVPSRTQGEHKDAPQKCLLTNCSSQLKCLPMRGWWYYWVPKVTNSKFMIWTLLSAFEKQNLVTETYSAQCSLVAFFSLCFGETAGVRNGKLP